MTLECEQAKLRFDNLTRKVRRLSNFTVNEGTNPSPTGSCVEDDVATIPDGPDVPDLHTPTESGGTFAGMPVPLGDLPSEDQDKLTELWDQCRVIECVGPGEYLHIYCHECGANASPVADGSPPCFFGFLRGLKAHYEKCHPSYAGTPGADIWHVCGKTSLSPEGVDTILHCNKTGEVQKIIRPVAAGKAARRTASLSRSRSITPARSPVRPRSSAVAATAHKGTPKSTQRSTAGMNATDTLGGT